MGILIKLMPMPHHELDDHWRVPVTKDTGIEPDPATKELTNKPTYTVYLGDEYKRIFTEDTLPDYVLSKITMLEASVDIKSPVLHDEFVMNSLDVHLPNRHYALKDIAWRVSSSLYVVVLNNIEFNGLKE